LQAEVRTDLDEIRSSIQTERSLTEIDPCREQWIERAQC
jgi:hypothetical protein